MPPLHPTKTYHKKPYAAISPLRPEVSQAGRAVMITGGSAGIGLAICRAFIAASAKTIILVGRRRSVLDEAISQLKEKEAANSTVTLLGISCDVSDLASTEALWAELAKQNIIVDTLVLNAATNSAPGPILDLGTNRMWEDFTVNVRALMHFTELFYKQDGVSGQDKRLVNVSSAIIHVFDGAARNLTNYSLTKNSGTMVLQSIAQHTKPPEMQIVSFHPGSILTPMARNAGYDENSNIPWDDGTSSFSSGKKQLSHRLISIENLPGHFAVWVASPEAEFLHGRFVWAHWDVDELKAGEIVEQIKASPNFLKIGVVGLA